MIANMLKHFTFALLLVFALTAEAQENGLLGGKAFTGMIGPSENPDLADTLYFNQGHFWSDICTRCGFVPGPYIAQESDGDIEFSGTLQSETRGRFDYDGIIGPKGGIVVSITWERRRWYWTSTREIMFAGQLSTSPQTDSISEIHRQMEASDPDANPLCARF
ncbi:hypothetical protein [Roseovarius sp. Pro17]|uniref:hypothetical protein n=1 Tax=Roseovarius sp. Pro17 TaxID=3108175 RepID=UPI002D78D7E1|nr:hypothetical protein [Roseovarius sp. Pro17]